MGRLKLGAVSFVVLDEVDACLINTETRRELHKLLSRRLSNSFISADDVEDSERSATDMLENKVYTDLAKADRSILASKATYRNNRQTIMCSATIPQRQHFAVQCHKNGWTETLPDVIHVTAGQLMPTQVELTRYVNVKTVLDLYNPLLSTQVEHEYIECELALRKACVRYLLRTEQKYVSPSRENNRVIGGYFDESMNRVNEAERSDRIFQAVVFMMSKNEAEDLYVELVNEREKDTSEMAIEDVGKSKMKNFVGLLCDSMSLDERANVMASFRLGEINTLICTDMAARGIDVPGITHVVQFNLPKTVENYLHRAGRTGRLGRSGKVITLTDYEEDFVIQRYSNELGITINKRVLKIKSASLPTTSTYSLFKKKVVKTKRDREE